MSETPRFIAADEPAPFEVVNGEAESSLLLVCDHASCRLPRAAGGLGVDAATLCSHRGFDIGAAALARTLADRLDATAVLAGYSRLLVDCNRDLLDPQAFLEVSDGVAIRGNLDLSAAQKEQRATQVYTPYHRAIETQVARLSGQRKQLVMLAIHSFTPVFAGMSRPWEVGILWDTDGRVAVPLMDGLRRAGLNVGDNQPYSAHARRLNNTLVRHAAMAGLPHACIEVRHDLIDSDSGVERMATVIGAAILALPPSLHSAPGHATDGTDEMRASDALVMQARGLVPKQAWCP